MESYFGEIRYAHSALARERMMTDLRLLFRHAEDFLRATAGDMSVKAMEARSRVTATLERAKANYELMQEQAVAAAKAAAKRADTVIRAHPYESIGVALGVGVLFGILIARK